MVTDNIFTEEISGKVLTTNIDMLKFVKQNDIIMFCLPPQTTQYLQPLDRAFLKSIIGYYYEACRSIIIKNHPNRAPNAQCKRKIILS